MKPSQRYHLNRLAENLVTPQRYGGGWVSKWGWTMALPVSTPKRWGVDGYGRYYLTDDGTKRAVKPYPFLRSPIDLWYKLRARIAILKWWWNQ